MTSSILKCFFLLLIIFSHQCFARECKSLQELDWLLGEWIHKKTEKVTVESWAAASNDTYEGYAATKTLEGTTTRYEALRLVLMADEIFYIAKVKENAFPIPFKATSCEENSVLFDNQTHDFPKTLEYIRNKEDQIQVNVGGKDGFIIIYVKNNGHK